MTLPSIERVAELLGGELLGDQVRAPGPGHSPADRSLSVKLDSKAPDGLVVHCFAPGDDDIKAKDYVREKLGLPEWKPEKKKTKTTGTTYSPITVRYVYRLADGTPF